MKTKLCLPLRALVLMAALTVAGTLRADPQLTSWFTAYSGQYARIYSTTNAEDTGDAVTTWSNSSLSQTLPAYDGVQEIYSSSNWVYLRTTGLGSHVMGPWPTSFPNLPVNQKVFYRIPRTATITVSTNKSITEGGAIGYFVDGVAMFNSWDAFYWNGTEDTSGAGTGYWNRDAFVNEGPTFDPANAHQQNTGVYHYHASPVAVRYFLGDHVYYDATTNGYSEMTNVVTQHSPILAWVSDGYPLYGPYGYSNPTNPASGVRRMISGYVLRNGQYGTQNLTANGRTNIPPWAVRLYGVTQNQSGPAVSSSYPLGRYMEDNDFLGDLGYAQSSNTFDLDEYNGRFCYTPEFPNGTYAYFVAISSDGTPVFPYNIGRGYYGVSTGSVVTSFSETVTTNFLGGTNSPLRLGSPVPNNNGTVTLAWSAVEGGSYAVQTTTNLSAWSTVATGVAPDKIVGSSTNDATGAAQFYRVGLTGVASFDSEFSTSTGGGGGGGGGIASVSPTSGSPGTTFTLTINLNATMVPPQNAPINSVTVGTITGASNVHVSTTQVTSSITIPANATPGAVTVSVVFPGPMSDPSNTVTFTLANGFNIN